MATLYKITGRLLLPDGSTADVGKLDLGMLGGVSIDPPDVRLNHQTFNVLEDGTVEVLAIQGLPAGLYDASYRSSKSGSRQKFSFNLSADTTWSALIAGPGVVVPSVDLVAEAQASATAAQTSETNAATSETNAATSASAAAASAQAAHDISNIDTSDGVVETLIPASSGSGTSAALAAGYVSVGEANINVAAFSSITAALASAPSGAKRLWLSAPQYVEAITLPDHTAIEGAGPTRTTIMLPDGANTSVIKNADHVNGNDGLSLRNVTIDGNKTNQAGQAAAVLSSDADGTVFGIEWHKVRGWSLDNVELQNVDGKGGYIVGDATVTPPSHTGSLLNVRCHDNALDGLHVGGAMRRIEHTHVMAYDNGRDGVWLDASETMALGVYGYRNGRDGIFVRNTFASTYNTLKSTMNGRHGIRALGLVGCDGAGWSAYSNGYVALHNNPQAAAETDSADIWFDDDATYSYGKSKSTTIIGITCGPQSAGMPWDDGNQGAPTEDWALRVGPAITDDLHLIGVRALNAGAKGLYSLPAWGAGNFLMTDSPGATNTVRQMRGVQKSFGPIYLGNTVQIGPGLWGATDVPDDTVGANGDFCLRSGAPATANQRIYNKQADHWVGLL